MIINNNNSNNSPALHMADWQLRASVGDAIHKAEEEEEDKEDDIEEEEEDEFGSVDVMEFANIGGECSFILFATQ